MSNDLISKKEIINLLYETFNKYRISTDKTSSIGGFGQEVFDKIRKLFTAYDVEEVVERLEELTELAYKRMIDTPSYSPFYTRYSARKEFLNIVKD